MARQLSLAPPRHQPAALGWQHALLHERRFSKIRGQPPHLPVAIAGRVEAGAADFLRVIGWLPGSAARLRLRERPLGCRRKGLLGRDSHGNLHRLTPRLRSHVTRPASEALPWLRSSLHSRASLIGGNTQSKNQRIVRVKSTSRTNTSRWERTVQSRRRCAISLQGKLRGAISAWECHTDATSLRRYDRSVTGRERQMPDDNADLDQMQAAYKAAVEKWIAAIKEEEALASVNHSIAEVDKWEAAHFKEDEIRAKVKAAKQRYEDALRQKFFGF